MKKILVKDLRVDQEKSNEQREKLDKFYNLHINQSRNSDEE